MEHSSDKAPRSTYLYYLIFFLIIGFIAFFWFAVFKKSLIHCNDGFDLWYPSIVTIRNTCRSVLSGGHLSLWSWTAGLGGDFLGNFNIFLDPFNYIASAFPLRYLDLGYGAATYARIFYAGLGMTAFLRYRFFSRSKCLIGGLSFAFCAFALWCMVHPQFLTAMVFFPFIILGVDRIDRERKPVMLIIFVALSLLTSVYFSYMTAVFTGIYLVVKFFYLDTERTVKTFFQRLIRFVIYILISLLIAAPSVLIMLRVLSQASTDSGVTISFFHTLKQYLMFIPVMLNGTQFFGNYSATAVGGIFIALVPAMFIAFRKKEYRLPIILFLVNVIFALSAFLCSMLNGFSYAVGRWFYSFAFFFIWAGLNAWEAKAEPDLDFVPKYRRGVLITGTVIIANVILAGLAGALNVTNLLITMVSVGFFALFALLFSAETPVFRHTDRIILAAVSLNLAVFWLLLWNPLTSAEYTNFIDLGTAEREYDRSMLREAANIEDDDFYRVDYIERIRRNGEYAIGTTFVANEQMYTDVPSVKCFLSYIDSDWRAFDEALCNNMNYYARVKSFGTDNRSRMNFLLGVKYFIATENNSGYAGYGSDLYGTGDLGNIYSYSHDPAIGYVYPYVFDENTFYNYFYTDREQILMQAAVVENSYDGNVPELEENALSLNTNELDYEIIETDGVDIQNGTLIVTKENGSFRIRVTDLENCELYLYFDELIRIPVDLDDLREAELGEDPGPLTLARFLLRNMTYHDDGDFVVTMRQGHISRQFRNAAGTSNQAVVAVRDYLSNLGYQESTPEAEISVTFNHPGTYTFDSLQLLTVDQSPFEEQASRLEANRLTITENRGDYLKGSVNTEGGFLYLSIPNSGGWSIYIDGEKADQLYRTNVGFIGTEMPAGEHTVELVYSPPGFRPVRFCTPVGIVLTAAVVILNRKRSQDKA